MEFVDLKRYYNSVPSMCGFGLVYDVSTDSLFDYACMKWHCPHCRSILKYRYYIEILKYVYTMELDRHCIITCDRKNVDSWDASFVYMNKKWVNLRLDLVRNYPELQYILMPRSQKSGYCHYHILFNKYVSWYYISKMCRKLGLGYASIQRNKSVADYLALDYWKDNEWVIPKNIRHIRSSRDIKLKNFVKHKCKLYDGYTDIDWIKLDLRNRFGVDSDFVFDDYCISKIQFMIKKGIF